MKRTSYLILFGFTFVLAGCFHTTVTTGLPAGDVVIDQPWATGWLFGLVPPATVNTASECPNGVAVVESEHSFLNSIARILTFSIYSPVHIKVTCAAGGTSSLDRSQDSRSLAKDASGAEIIEAFRVAGNEAQATGEAIFITFE